ncbi:MAG: hypothetical protein GY730_06150 [bacterium]|nr:hypothetical protein [bacterium]
MVFSRFNNVLTDIFSHLKEGASVSRESWNHGVQTDTVNILKNTISNQVWIHSSKDGNGDSHLKAGIIS